ncbi:MAG: radical SAM protein, partial [Pseudolabrys sp.]
LPRENPFLFYSRYFGESVVKMWRYWSVYRQCKSILDEVLAAPDRWTYTDLAIAPPREDEFETLDLYHATAGGEAALARKQRDDAIRNSKHAAISQAPATSTAG